MTDVEGSPGAFLTGGERVYLDHAAHSPLRPAAALAWQQVQGVIGNPSGLHTSARRARALLEDARERVADRLGAHPTEVVFTSGGSEADTLAVLGGIRARADLGRPRLVISAVEHPAVLDAVGRWGDTVVLAVDRDARVDLPRAAELVDAACGVVSVQSVNNEQGTVQPVAELAEIAHQHGAWFHCDAVQGLLWPGVDFHTSRADLVSMSGHKVGAPVGIGVLLCRRTVELAPVGLGGGQERGVRSGTQPVALACALAAALDELVEHRDVELSRTRSLGQSVRRLAGSLPGTRLRGGTTPHPGIVSVTFEGLRADDLLLLLDREGVDASVGSACRAGVHQPSEVVLAAGGTMEEALSTVRFSLGHTTTAHDVEHLERVLPEAVATARQVFGTRH